MNANKTTPRNDANSGTATKAGTERAAGMTPPKHLIWGRSLNRRWFKSEIRIGHDAPRRWTIEQGIDGLWRGFWEGELISGGTTTLREQKRRLNEAAAILCHPKGRP